MAPMSWNELPARFNHGPRNSRECESQETTPKYLERSRNNRPIH